MVTSSKTISVRQFDYDRLASYKIIERNKRKKGSKSYLDVVTAFDIETTRIKEIDQSVMYIWALQFDLDTTIVGRTWDEFFEMIDKFREYLKDTCYMVVYVHNLSYEFQFLKGLYDFEPDEVFATESRKVLKCTMYDCIEFRCSYMLTNLSLDHFLKKMNVENLKLSGDTFDYTKERYYWTPLSEYELQYMINDVKGLVQALVKQLAIDNDTLQTVPLTSTGYVRRDMKRSMKNYNHDQMREMLPGVTIYKLLREAFRGGNTMSNRYYTDDIIENVSSCDIVSSYPFQMCCKKYPMTKFQKEEASPEIFKKLTDLKALALLCSCTFYNIRLKSIFIGYPYLSKDKCREIIGGINSNGRILEAKRLSTTITDIDFRIILDIYEWDGMEVHKLYSSKYQMLPIQFRSVVLNYYKIKTELKGVAEGTDEYDFYMKNKEKLNGCYGMTVEDPGKDHVKFVNGEYVTEEISLKSLLEKHNKSAYLCYQWGVWVTAHARYELHQGMKLCGKYGEQYVYCDTDSIKYIGDIPIEKLNRQTQKLAEKYKAYASDNKGTVHYMGVFEDEGYSKPNRFCTMGAKKYVLEDSDKKLHITIAGVNKAKGGEELGKLENFKEGFIFNKAGGTESIFNDNVDEIVEIEGHKVHITDNVCIKNSTYTLGLTAEYRQILEGCIEIRYSDHDIPGLYKVKNE